MSSPWRRSDTALRGRLRRRTGLEQPDEERDPTRYLRKEDVFVLGVSAASDGTETVEDGSADSSAVTSVAGSARMAGAQVEAQLRGERDGLPTEICGWPRSAPSGARADHL
jgi:hypothetical protein